MKPDMLGTIGQGVTGMFDTATGSVLGLLHFLKDYEAYQQTRIAARRTPRALGVATGYGSLAGLESIVPETSEVRDVMLKDLLGGLFPTG